MRTVGKFELNTHTHTHTHTTVHGPPIRLFSHVPQHDAMFPSSQLARQLISPRQVAGLILSGLSSAPLHVVVGVATMVGRRTTHHASHRGVLERAHTKPAVTEASVEGKVPTLSGASHVLTAKPAETTGTAGSSNNMAPEAQMENVLGGARCPTFDVNPPGENDAGHDSFFFDCWAWSCQRFRFVW